MTDLKPTTESNRPPTPLDDLIDAIVDGVADEQAWDEFRALAGASTEPWRRLAEEQRLLTLLQSGYDEATKQALRIELPAGVPAVEGHRGSLAMSWRPMLGWAAALMMAMAWAGSILIPDAPPATPLGNSLLAQYLAQPHVVGELPLDVRGVTPTEDGDCITYIRQIVERRPVNLYHLQLDENSNPVLREANQEPAILASRY